MSNAVVTAARRSEGNDLVINIIESEHWTLWTLERTFNCEPSSFEELKKEEEKKSSEPKCAKATTVVNWDYNLNILFDDFVLVTLTHLHMSNSVRSSKFRSVSLYIVQYSSTTITYRIHKIFNKYQGNHVIGRFDMYSLVVVVVAVAVATYFTLLAFRLPHQTSGWLIVYLNYRCTMF